MGTTWEVLFDDLDDAVSIGDIAIAPDDANTVWVGTGENNNRQSGSWGNGVYKSIDGGQTWKHMGLRDSKHIARIIVDPIDHDVVYVAALGSLYGPGKERGVYKSTDGGLTWNNVLFVDQDTGATELVQDPSNNKVLYAATYQRRRATWGFNGGGPGSAMWKSSDAGRTWTKLTNGVPTGHLGRIGMDVYRANPNIVYARIEAPTTESGTYRSDDAGLTWRRMSNVNPRPMYFSQIRIDPTNDLRVYVLGVQLHISDDGGKTFIENGTMHSDHHAMWINPKNPNHLIDGNDGGVGISWDKGKTWEGIYNMDLAQYYHVGYDMETPYNLCGGMQDNYTWCGPSAVRSRNGIVNDDWYQIQGGDGFEAVIDPNDPRHDLRRIAGRQRRPRQPPHQRARDDPAAAQSRRVGLSLELEHADSHLAAHLVHHLRRRQPRLQLDRSRPDVDADQPGPDAERRSRNAVAHGHHGQRLHPREARRRAVLRQPRAGGRVAEAGGRAVCRRRRRQRQHDEGWRQDLDEHQRALPEHAEERLRVRARRIGARRQHGLCLVRQPHERRLRQLCLRERRRRTELPFDQRKHSQGPGRS